MAKDSQIEIYIYLALYIWAAFLLINILGFFLLKIVFYKKLKHRKIVTKETTTQQHWEEFKNSLRSTFIFMLAAFFINWAYQKGITPIHARWDQWGVLYFILSFFLLHQYHDTYFYWTHRALHEITWLKKHHVAHHASRVPTMLAANSFSIVEAIIQAGFYITAVFIIPAHYGIHLYFYFFVIWIAAWGHVEFEFWPSSLYRLPYGNTFNSLTHHNLHHYYAHGNYGLYYRFWDELCGTLHPETYPHFYRVQKNIAAEAGKTISSLRPDAQDIVGLYFEEAQVLGENINIILDAKKSQSSISKFNKNELNNIPHSYCDGISSLKLWHNEHKLDLKMVEKIKDTPRKFKAMNILPIAVELSQIFYRLIFKNYLWPEHLRNKEKEQHFFQLILTKEETKSLITKAKELGVSTNFLLIHLLSNSMPEEISQQNWVIPFWAHKKQEPRETAKIANHASFFEYIPSSKSINLDQEYALYKQRLLGASSFLWTKSYILLSSFLKFGFKFWIWAGLKFLNRTGVISNLGTYEGQAGESIQIAPPALSNTPLAIGLITYNEQLSICVHSHPKFGPNDETILSILNNLKAKF